MLVPSSGQKSIHALFEIAFVFEQAKKYIKKLMKSR